MTKSRSWMLGTALLLVAFLVSPVLAQIGGQASLVGTIQDQSGGVLPGVEVTVTNVETGTTRTVITNDSGNYVVERLQPGEYSVAAELTGFKRAVVRGIVLKVAERSRTDVTLAVGQISEEVFVEGSGSVIQTESGTISETISEDQVREIPLNGRNFLQLTTLTPGVVDPENSINSNAKGTVSVNGYGDLGNNILLDGIGNQADGIAGRMNFAPSLELVKEFKVQSSIYSAEYGKTAGAQINIVTKRGEQNYHGSLFWYHRNDNTEARNFFQSGAPAEFRRNDFGASVGGPIVPGKDDAKNFFFFVWESRREGRGLTASMNVPPIPFRSGDFSGAPETIYDPFTLDPETGLREPFPNNQIPGDRISPQAQFFIPFYPSPQTDGRFGNFISNPTRVQDTDQFSFRYDGDFTESDSIMARFTWNDDQQLEPRGLVPVATPIEGFGELIGFEGRNFQVNWTHTFSPSAINSFSFGFSSFKADRRNEQTGRNVFEEAGISGVNPQSQTGGFPWLIPSGWTGIGDDPFNPQLAPMDNWQWADTVTHITGNHSLKYGVDVIRNTLDLTFNALDRGAIFFNPVFTTPGPGMSGNEAHAWADYLLGFPASSTKRVNPILQDLGQWWGMAFIQDDWNVHPDVTLNVGLRWEMWRRPIEENNRLSQLDIFRFDEPQWVVAGSPEAESVGLPRSFDSTDKNDFAPRFGFAWRILGNDRWVLRGGYGLFYQWIVLDKQNNLGLGEPFNSQTNLANPPDIPVFDLSAPYSSALLPSASGNTIPIDNRTPYNQQYSLTLAHELTNEIGVEFGYVGNAARKNQFGLNLNQPAPGPGSVGPRRPFPEWADITAFANWGTSHYDALQVTVRKDAGTDGLSLLTSYTWSKSMAAGNTGGVFHFGVPIRDTTRWKDDAGPGPFDIRQRLSISSQYELPFGRGRAFGTDMSPLADAIIGGWKLGGIASFQAGGRLTPGSIVNFSNSGASRPNVTGDPNTGPETREKWFNTEAFADADQFTFGNAGTGIIEGPGFALFDIAIYKSFTIMEGHRLQFRTEFFNAFNHTNWRNPNTSYGSGAFGGIFAARDSRQIQFALRYDF